MLSRISIHTVPIVVFASVQVRMNTGLSPERILHRGGHAPEYIGLPCRHRTKFLETHIAAVKSLTLVEPQIHAIDRVSKSLRRPKTILMFQSALSLMSMTLMHQPFRYVKKALYSFFPTLTLTGKMSHNTEKLSFLFLFNHHLR